MAKQSSLPIYQWKSAPSKVKDISVGFAGSRFTKRTEANEPREARIEVVKGSRGKG